MQYFYRRLRAAALFLLIAAPLPCFAVDTHVWEQSDQGDFIRGTLKHLSVRSDGRVTLSPEFKELDSTGTPYLWALAKNSKGTVFYAGGAPTGATTKVFELPRNGKPKVLAELTGLEVHALAVDSRDRVYAAVLPDAKIYRIDESGKPQLFFDPKCKYVWGMAFDRSDNLFVATGDAGLIYRVAPDGKGAKFFDTEETHARSLLIDEDGNLIVGTEPSGLVLRITPKGESFVLYETNKREVTAVAEHDGIIYAAAVGSRSGAATVTGAPPVLPATTQPPVAPTGAPRVPGPPLAGPAVGTLNASVTGGSEFYRIQKDGLAERIWSSPTDLVYAVAFDASGRPLLGTGNKGIIYRVDSDQLSTQLLNAPPTQVTAFLPAANGVVYAATGNVGTLYSIGPAMETKGTLESDVLDANGFTYWGKAHMTSALHGGTITLETRSGNVNHPESNWSPWSKVDVSELGGQVQSPPARFLQYRLTFNCGGAAASPELTAVDIAYLAKNIAPKVNTVELAPFNYRQAPTTVSLERSTAPSGSPSTLTLPAVGQKRNVPSNPAVEGAGNATLQYSKGFMTVRWSASDPNGDPLVYKLDIRSKDGTTYHPLKEKLQDRFYAFDTSAFPDGKYVVRVTASDGPGNTPAEELTTSLESEPFTIDNTPPEISDVKISKGDVRFTARDALSWIDKAEYSIDGGQWVLLNPLNKVTDSQELSYELHAQAGQTIAVRVFDEDDNVIVKQFRAQ